MVAVALSMKLKMENENGDQNETDESLGDDENSPQQPDAGVTDEGVTGVEAVDGTQDKQELQLQ